MGTSVSTLSFYIRHECPNLYSTFFSTETGKPRREDDVLEADGTAAVGACVHNQRIIINKEMPAVKVSAAQANAGQLGMHSATPANAVSDFDRRWTLKSRFSRKLKVCPLT